jgi:hypothetical protein
MSSIILEIKSEDFENCSKEFDNSNDCLLATAGKRQFNTTNVREYTDYMIVDDHIKYNHDYFWQDDWERAMATKKPFNITLHPII